MKIWVKTFGCRVNQYDGERLASRLSNGALRAESFEDADLCLLNTCTITAEADNEALRLARKISKVNPAARLVVTGCLASRDPEKVRAAAPHALVVGNEGKDSLPAALGCAAAPAELARFSGKARAFVKIQDGCNMVCAFCVVPSVRPELSSRPWAQVESECRSLIEAGHEELVLCGIRLGRYKSGGVDLATAIERLEALPGRFRIRLSSLEITDLNDRIIGLIKEGKLCPSVHAPLQSGSDRVLKAMKRWYSAGFYERRVEALRKEAPDAAVFADVITGFPGESWDDHAATVSVIKRLRLNGLHVFRYSPRPDTSAYRLKRIPPQDLQARARELRALDHELRRRHAESAIGSRRQAAMELNGLEGLAEDFLPVVVGERLSPGIHELRIVGVDGYKAVAQRRVESA